MTDPDATTHDGMIREDVPESLDGERIDRLVALLGDISRAGAAELIGNYQVTIDGVAAKNRSVRVTAGQRVEFPAPQPEAPLEVTADAGIEFEVVHEDDVVVVVNKPAGLVVHPGHGNPDATLVNGLVARFPDIADVGEPQRPGLVHRLDAGTSGLLAVARTEEARLFLADQLIDHSMMRRYDALVHRSPSPSNGVVDAPIGRSARQPTRMAVSQTGREARTRYEVRAAWTEPLVSLLSCELETGRTHQIRVHLDAIGHPVVADPTYGPRRDTLGLSRPFLHAGTLRFRHPETNEPLEVHAPLPSELQDVLDRLDAAAEAEAATVEPGDIAEQPR